MNKFWITILFAFFLMTYSSYSQEILEVEGNVKVANLTTGSSSDSVVVLLPDNTLGIRDAKTIGSSREQVELYWWARGFISAADQMRYGIQGSGFSAALTGAEQPSPVAGVIKNLQIHMNRDVDSGCEIEVVLIKNGAETDLKVFFDSTSGIGIQENTAVSIAVNKGDLISFVTKEVGGVSPGGSTYLTGSAQLVKT